MTDSIKTLVTYRLDRARETLDEAQLLLASGHVNTYVNRLYYACFYAVSAYLLSQDKSSAKHSGVRALFHQQVVKPGLVDQELGQHYDRLFDNRQKATMPIWSNLMQLMWLNGMRKLSISCRR